MLFNIWLGTTIVVAIFCIAQLAIIKFLFPRIFGSRDMGFRKFTTAFLLLGYAIVEVGIAVIFGIFHLLIQAGIFN